MFPRRLHKLLLALSVLCLAFIYLYIYMDATDQCHFTVTKQYFWLGEDVGKRFTDNSISSIRQGARKVTQLDQVLEYPWLSDSVLSRALNKQQHAEMLNLTFILAQLLEASNVTYMMSYGSLLGSYIFQDIIPWDDDMDFLVDWKDISKVKALFQNEAIRGRYGAHSFGDVEDMWDVDKLRLENVTDGLNLNIILKKVTEKLATSGQSSKSEDIFQQIKQEHSACMAWRQRGPRYYKVKFYALDAQPAGNYNWTWPFVDLVFYESIGNQMCTLDAEGVRYRMCQRKDVVFPLTQRPLGNLGLPAPRDTRAFLHKRFPHFACMVGDWNHVHEHRHEKADMKQDCQKLLPTYPIVHRVCEPGRKRGVTEKLLFRDTTLRSMYFPNQTCPQNSDIFSLA